MKKTLSAVLITTALAALSSSANAGYFQFNQDGTGLAGASLTNKIWMTANPDPTTIRIDTGADGLVGNNDTFSETGSYDVFKLSGAGNVTVTGITATFQMTGKLTNFVTDGSFFSVPFAGQGSVVNPLALANDLYDIIFTGGVITFSDGVTPIATFNITGGGASDFGFLASGIATQALGVDAKLVSSDDNYWFDAYGNALDSNPLVFGLATGSVNFDGLGSDPTNDPTGVYLRVGNNGTTATINVPEPGALALLGVGLLGLGATRRRKVTQK